MTRKPPTMKEFQHTYKSEYKAWCNAKSKAKSRGVTVSKNFLCFRAFFKAVGRKPEKSFSLDRINNNEGYDLNNIRWADKTQQSNNRSNTIFLTYEGSNNDYLGLQKPLTEWARTLKLPASRLRRQRSDGWTDTEIIDGEREKKIKQFHQMSIYELQNYKPWPKENIIEWEERYLQDRYEDEMRFEFFKRISLRSRRKPIIELAAELGLLDVRKFCDGQAAHYEKLNYKQMGYWLITKDLSKSDKAKFNSMRKDYNAAKNLICSEEKKWTIALKRKYQFIESEKVSNSFKYRFIPNP